MPEESGIYGRVTARIKAGDEAPDLVFTRILNADVERAVWNATRFSGRLTVLRFFPDTSHNQQAVSRWNELVRHFADEPVQFVWITGEKETSLLPWLARHPIGGWVAHDPEGVTGRAYGMEIPAAVLIGSDRRVIGFDPRMLPSVETVVAAMEGRITTVSPIPGPAFDSFLESRLVLLSAEPPRMPRRDDHKPDFPPSYDLHISATKHKNGGGNFGSMDFYSFQRYDLKDMLAELYATNPIRIVLPPSLDDGQYYDFEMVLPEPEGKDAIYNRFRQGIDRHFQVTTSPEERELNVLVVTARGTPPVSKMRRGARRSFASASSVGYQVMRPAGTLRTGDPHPKVHNIGNIRSIAVDGSTDDFCRLLERELDCPLVNETNLEGAFSFCVEAKGMENDFLELVRDQLHLNILPAVRSVPVLVLTLR